MITLGYAYRSFANDPGADAAYDIASILVEMYQFSLAIAWYEKLLELDPDDRASEGTLAYLYQQCRKYDKSTGLAKKMLAETTTGEGELIDELYCLIADNYCYSSEISEAISWLDKIIKESKNPELVKYTKNTKKNWSNI